MNIDCLVNEIYNRTIDIVLNNTQDSNKQILQEGYKQYLINNYGDIKLDEEPYNNKPINELIDKYVELETMDWEDELEDNKLSTFIIDDAYEQICKISNIAYDYAKLRLFEQDSNYKSIISVEEATKTIENLYYLQSQLKSYNNERAEMIISESIMDLLYASGQTDNMSLRIGREYEKISQIIKK